MIEENELIEESLRSKQKGRKLSRMKEEKFTNSGQTVVIWCFRDFCQNKKFHEDTFTTQSRQLRQLRSLQKRHAQFNQSYSTTSNTADEEEQEDESPASKRTKHSPSSSSSEIHDINQNGDYLMKKITTSRGKKCVERYRKVQYSIL